MIWPLRQWWRSRLEVTVVFVVCIAVVGVAIANAQVVSTAKIVVNDNWRGLYDILVTAPGQDFGGAATDGLVDSNFVTSAGQSGISLAQLARVRGISGVSVAAPIGFVGSLRDAPQSPSLIVMDDPVGGASDLSQQTEILRLSSTLTRQTTLGQTVLSKSSGIVQLSKRTASDVTSLTPSTTALGYPNEFAPQTNNLYYQVTLGALPSFPSTVIAVDPKAEMALLGPKAGAYLKPLLQLPAQRTTASGDEWASAVDSSEYLVQQTAIQPAVADKVTSDPIVPLLVNSSRDANLKITVSISRDLDSAAPAASQTELQALLKTGSFAPPTLLTKSISDLATPFTSPDLSLLLPGAPLPKGEKPGSFYGSNTGLVPELVSRPQYAHASGKLAATDAPEFLVKSGGIVAADGTAVDSSSASLTGQDPSVGQTRAYRKSTKTSGGSGATALPAPVGQFTNADLTSKAVNSVSYVPSGIYDGSKSVLAKGAGATSATDGTSLQANLSGRDFLSSPPGAFTDLRGGETLRGSTPIDAIRVRISGLHSFSAAGRAKVQKVAAQIASLGLKATIVAGSSPEPVEVYVPEYSVGATSPHADLGWVKQSWTTLGAAVTVTAALNTMQCALLISSLAAVLAAFTSAILIGARRRRSQSQLLRDIGWTDSQLRRYWATAQAPSAIAVAAVTLVVYLLSGRSAIGGLALVGIFVIAAASSALGVWFALQKANASPTAKLRRASRVQTIAQLSWRHIVSAPAAIILQVFGIAAVGVCSTLCYCALATAQVEAGQTRLAGVATNSTELASIILGVTGVVAAIVLSTLGRRAEVARRNEEARVLVGIGFEQPLVRRLRRFEAMVVGAIGLVVTLIVAALILQISGLGFWVILVAFAASIVAVASITLSTSGKVTQ